MAYWLDQILAKLNQPPLTPEAKAYTPPKLTAPEPPDIYPTFPNYHPQANTPPTIQATTPPAPAAAAPTVTAAPGMTMSDIERIWKQRVAQSPTSPGAPFFPPSLVPAVPAGNSLSDYQSHGSFITFPSIGEQIAAPELLSTEVGYYPGPSFFDGRFGRAPVSFGSTPARLWHQNFMAILEGNYPRAEWQDPAVRQEAARQAWELVWGRPLQ